MDNSEEQIKRLSVAMMHLENESDISGFLRDLLSAQELSHFAARWAAVKCLVNACEGEKRKITALRAGVSEQTVTRARNTVLAKHSSGVARNLAQRLSGE